MASAATELLIGKIATILENEASSIAGVRDQIDEIKLELVSMRSFLKDAEGKQALTAGEETWITSVRDLTYDVEDIIDEYMYHMYKHKTARRFVRWLRKTIYLPKNIWRRRQIANDLKKIAMRIKAIPERNQRYGVGTLEEATSSADNSIPQWAKNQAESSLYIKEDELVGIESNKQMLMGLLLNGELNQMVVPVVGMGGSGKTTLVAKCFTDDKVKRYFSCYAWITVSQKYSIEDLFKRLIKEFYQGRKEEVPQYLNSMSYKELLGMLINYMESERYLVVLDDVWDFKLWQEIKIAIQDKQHGSRIVLTTRNQDIASYNFGVESRTVKIEPLEDHEAWELFCKKAFPYPDQSCPKEHESLARELVKKCEGLPLAVVALGGLMSSKQPSEWKKIQSSLNWHLTNDPMLEPVKSILLISFNNLPSRWKHCFLYCSLFPEDHYIKRNRLLRMWIAEGFVEPMKGVTPEGVAECYLRGLIARSMLQVVQRRDDGRPRSCKMHDLMLELALSISRKEKFGDVYDGSELVEEIGGRRMSIQTTKGQITSCKGTLQIRSFLVFASSMLSLSMLEKVSSSGLKLLRVLDMENVPIDRFPDELVYLFNLKYLNLKGTLIKELPESIGRLRNLETLNIRNSKIEALPRAISKLPNLRHLISGHALGDYMEFLWHLIIDHTINDDYMEFTFRKGTKVPSDISKCKNLQVLSIIKSEGEFIKQVGNMTQLTKIGITNVKAKDEVDLCHSIGNLKLLESLNLMATDEDELLPVNALASPPPQLRDVFLGGKLERVPLWFGSLHNITYMALSWSRLEEDPLPHIHSLPNLRELQLSNAVVGRQLCFCRGFLMLKILMVEDFPLLNDIMIEKGAMPNLQTFGLFDCMELKTMPYGIEYLVNLKSLQLKSIPPQIINSIRKGGVDHPKVQHIPEIYHLYETEFGRCYESLS